MFYKIIKIILPFALVANGFCASAQNLYDNGLWKKEVAREIILNMPAAPSPHNSKATHNATLIEMIVSTIKAGKLTAYTNADIYFTEKLKADELSEMVTSKRDTFMVTDPVTGKEKRKIINREFKPESIRKYRLLENWTFNPYTCKTEIQILGFAPIREIYASDGSFRGVQAMFWLHYNDVQPILAEYSRSKPKYTFTAALWKDYFSDSNSKVENKPFEGKATRIIDVSGEKEDTLVHRLRDITSDSALEGIILGLQLSGSVTSYVDSTFKSVLPADPARKTWHRVDTQVITDPVAGKEITKYSYRSLFNDREDCKIMLFENWYYDPVLGKTEIKLIGIAPTIEMRDSKASPLFWLRFDDIRDLIARYNQYHPNTTFAGFLWNNYFFSEVKPELQN